MSFSGVRHVVRMSVCLCAMSVDCVKRVRGMVTMEHYREVDIELSESARITMDALE